MERFRKYQRSWRAAWCLLLLGALVPGKGQAFCGFYVGKADGTLSNEKSQVVLVRRDHRTVISMLNEFKGDLKDFALVVPVPVLLQKDQIHIGDRDLFEKLDAYSTPRLVEYFDPDPCRRGRRSRRWSVPGWRRGAPACWPGPSPGHRRRSADPG